MPKNLAKVVTVCIGIHLLVFSGDVILIIPIPQKEKN